MASKKKTPATTPAAAPAGDAMAAALDAINALAAGGGGADPNKKVAGPSLSGIQAAQEAGTIPKDFKPWMMGDEWDQVLGLPPDVRARLKANMAAAGLYGTKPFVTGGAWSDDDAAAMTSVLGYANGKGISSLVEATKKYAEEEITFGTQAKAPKAPLVSRFANPESIRQVVRKSSMDLLGQRLPDEEENRLIAGFQNQYQESQRAQHAAQSAEGGGSFTEALDPAEYAAGQLENRPEAGAKRYLDAFDAIMGSLGTVVPGPTLTAGGGVSY